MIKSFRHKGLALFFATGEINDCNRSRRSDCVLSCRCCMRRRMFGKWTRRVCACTRLKALLPGSWAVNLDENFRVTFRFAAGHAYEVDYVDYH